MRLRLRSSTTIHVGDRPLRFRIGRTVGLEGEDLEAERTAEALTGQSSPLLLASHLMEDLVRQHPLSWRAQLLAATLRGGLRDWSAPASAAHDLYLLSMLRREMLAEDLASLDHHLTKITIRWLYEQGPKIRQLLARTPNAIPVAERLLQDPEPAVRLAAVRNVKIASSLRSQLDSDPDTTIRTFARLASRKIEPDYIY